MGIGTIFDIIVAGILLLVIYASAKKGFAKIVFNILGLIAAFIVAVFLSGFLADLIYGLAFKDAAVESVSTNLTAIRAAQSLPDRIDLIFSGYPGFVRNLAVLFGITSPGADTDLQEILLRNSGVAEAVTRRMIEPVISGMLSLGAFVLLFFLGIIISGAIFKTIDPVFKLPIVRTVNMLLGGVFGLVKGVIFCIVFTALFILIIGLISDDFTSAVNGLFKSSFIFKYALTENPLLFKS